MTINNENTSIAIKAIMVAYQELPFNGFRLHIEDHAPETIQVAGKQQPEQESKREISEEDLPDFVRERIRTTAGGSIASRLVGAAIPAETILAAGWDGEVYDHMVIFYEPIIKLSRSLDELFELVKKYVRHEWRHGCQFNWLREHGISPFTALQQEAETVYGEGPLERDAHLFQDGIIDELDVAMASFIS